MSFDQFAEQASRHVGKAWFFGLVVAAIVAWLPTLVLWDTGPSDLLVDSLTNPLSLLLLVLLQNSQNRTDDAKDARQDEIEHGLAAVLDHLAERVDDDDAAARLTEQARKLVRNAQRSESMSTAGLDDGR